MKAAPILFAAAVALAGCSQSTQSNPRMVSSVKQSSYVEEYPTTLEATMKSAVDRENKAKEVIEAMPNYTKSLKGADAARVLAVVNAADESGRSVGYVQRSRELAAAGAFFEDEREPISRRVAGAAQSKVKEAKCEADVGGSVSYALKDGVEKQIEKRLRDRNEAHAVIEHNRTAIGKDNVAELEKQADAIALASYNVYIALPDDRARLNTLLSERSDVETTIDRVLEEERVYQAESGRTDADRKASSDRTAQLMKGKATLRAFGDEGSKLQRSLDDQIPQFQKSYEDALKQIRTQLTPPPPPR